MSTRGVARFSFVCAFCRLPSSCHFGESSRACLTRQRNTGAASDSVMGARGARMCLITCGFGGLCDAKEIRMAFSCLPGAPRRNFQPRGEIPRDTPFYEGSVLKNKSVADRCEVKVARSLGISEGRR